MIYIIILKYILYIINNINHIVNIFTNYIKRFKFYFSSRHGYYLKLKKILEYKNTKSIEEYDIVGITNLLFDNGLNKVCLIIWNNNELLRRVVINHPIKGSVELMKNNISSLIINRGGNSLASKPNVFFFYNYHQMVICFTDIYLTQPWLRKEINYNDIATLYFISKNERNETQPQIDFHPVPFSCLYIDNGDVSDDDNNNNVNYNINNNNYNNSKSKNHNPNIYSIKSHCDHNYN